MQKKLLSLMMMIGFGSVYCSEMNTENDKQAEKKFKDTFQELWDDYFGKNDVILADYEKQLITDYTEALITAVSDSGDTNAIESRFKENQEQNKKIFDNKNMVFDDSKEGWFNWGATSASEESIKGLFQKQSKTLQAKQDKKNKTYKDNYTQHQNNYNECVKATMKRKLAERHYNLFQRYADGLEQCGNDVVCLKKRDISWKNIQKPEFLESQDEQIFDALYMLIMEKDIPLSREQLIEIAGSVSFDSKNPDLKDKTLTEQIALGKALINEKIRRILNPDAQDKQDQEKEKISILDPKDDQNNQGALSE